MLATTATARICYFYRKVNEATYSSFQIAYFQIADWNHVASSSKLSITDDTHFTYGSLQRSFNELKIRLRDLNQNKVCRYVVRLRCVGEIVNELSDEGILLVVQRLIVL